MILLQLVVLTGFASCHAMVKHLGEPASPPIKPHGQRPAHEHRVMEHTKPILQQSGSSQDDGPDPPLQRSRTLTRNEPDVSRPDLAAGQRDDTSNGSDLENKLMTEKVMAHGRKKTRQDTKSQKSIIKRISASLKQRPGIRNRNYPDRNKSKRIIIRPSDQPKGFDPMQLMPSRKMRADRRRKRNSYDAPRCVWLNITCYQRRDCGSSYKCDNYNEGNYTYSECCEVTRQPVTPVKLKDQCDVNQSCPKRKTDPKRTQNCADNEFCSAFYKCCKVLGESNRRPDQIKNITISKGGTVEWTGLKEKVRYYIHFEQWNKIPNTPENKKFSRHGTEFMPSYKLISRLKPNFLYGMALYGVNGNSSSKQDMKTYLYPGSDTMPSVSLRRSDSTTLRLSWKRLNDTQDYMITYYESSTGESHKLSRWCSVEKCPTENNGTNYYYIINGLKPSTIYMVKVWAMYGTNGETIGGEWLTVKTDDLPLPKVENIRATTLNNTSLYIRWNSTNMIRIIYKGSWEKVSERTQIYGGTHVALSGLLPNRTYDIKVVAVSQDGHEGIGEWHNGVATMGHVMNVAPLNVSIKALNFTALNVTWFEPHGKVDYFFGQCIEQNGYTEGYSNKFMYNFNRSSRSTKPLQFHHVFGGLKPNRNYRINILAVNNVSTTPDDWHSVKSPGPETCPDGSSLGEPCSDSHNCEHSSTSYCPSTTNHCCARPSTSSVSTTTPAATTAFSVDPGLVPLPVGKKPTGGDPDETSHTAETLSNLTTAIEDLISISSIDSITNENVVFEMILADCLKPIRDSVSRLMTYPYHSVISEIGNVTRKAMKIFPEGNYQRTKKVLARIRENGFRTEAAGSDNTTNKSELNLRERVDIFVTQVTNCVNGMPQLTKLRNLKNGPAGGITEILTNRINVSGKSTTDAFEGIIQDLKGGGIKEAIIHILTAGHSVSDPDGFTRTEAYKGAAINYTAKLMDILKKDAVFEGKGVLFELVKMIVTDDPDIINVVARMLGNNSGVNVDDLVRQTTERLLNDPSGLTDFFDKLVNGLTVIPPGVADVIRKAAEVVRKGMNATKLGAIALGNNVKFAIDGNEKTMLALILQVTKDALFAIPSDEHIDEVDSIAIDKELLKNLFRSFTVAASRKDVDKNHLGDYVKGVIETLVSADQFTRLLKQIQSRAKKLGMDVETTGKTMAMIDYQKNEGKRIKQIMESIPKLVNPEKTETPVSKIGPEDIFKSRVKDKNITSEMVKKKVGNNKTIEEMIGQLVTNGHHSNRTTEMTDNDVVEANKFIKSIMDKYRVTNPDEFGGLTWDVAEKLAESSPHILANVTNMLYDKNVTDGATPKQVADEIHDEIDQDSTKPAPTFLNFMKRKMLELFPAADPSNIAELKKKFEKMFAELKKYADKQKQTEKNYTTFGETFGKDQGEKANTALQSIVDSMKLTLNTRRKRGPSPAAINAMNGFVNTILDLIGLNNGANSANLRNLLKGIAHGTTQPGANALNTEAGSLAGATTKGGNGATKDVGINNGKNSGDMADALQEGLSNMNAGDDNDDDDDGDSLWWIGLIIGILLLIIIIIVVILLLRRRKKEEPVEPEIEVVAVAADMVSETMTTYGAELPVVVMTSVVTTTTTHYQPGDPETEPTQLSEEVLTGVGGEQVININVIHVNQDKEESSTDDVDSDADAHTDGHILTETEQSEVLYNADGTKQEPKEKKEKKRIKKSEKKKKLEEKQKKLDEDKDQVEQKKVDKEINKDTQQQIIIIHEAQTKSREKEINNENENEMKEKEKSEKKDETGQVIIIHHQYDGPKSKETDQLEKPKSQQEKDENQKNETKVTSKKESITKLTTNQQEDQQKIGDEENKMTRKESATKSAAKPETSSKQRAEDDEKDTKNKKSVSKSAINAEENQFRTANDDDKQTKRRESATKSAAKPAENDKKSKRDGSRTQVSQKPGESKSQVGSVKKTNLNDLTTKSKAKTDEQKSEKLKSEKLKSKFDSADVKANENKSKTQEMQREFQQSDTRQTAAELEQVNKSTHQQTAYEKEKALYADPNYETVVHQAQQPTAQLHVGQAKYEGKENVVTKKVITVTTITTTNQEEGKK